MMDNTAIFACQAAIKLIELRLKALEPTTRLSTQLAKAPGDDARKTAHELACLVDVEIGEIYEIAKGLGLIVNGYHPEI